ncbi:hypothetical protein LPJ66_003710 [Kickxella alabastrina]|uniref:Uncharacterized protein n=1 Tax=Kickxella alabastrina TaxID=61397 RepID=A0ACC1IMW5_9FUNG|nr:hypothetical protein LPJ66_003710 [Kickxella alabastrina]
MQVVAGKQGMWMDAGVLVFNVLGYFQMGLLGQLAAYFRYTRRLDADLMKSLGTWSSAVNMGADAVAASYYVVVGEKDDAHCRACIKHVQLSQEHNICMEDISSECPWFSAVRKGQRLGALCGDDSKAAGVGRDFPLGLCNMRLCRLLPMIQMMMGVLADSLLLLVAGLEMQSPEITCRLLYLLCILGRELPLVLRGLTLHALAALNVYTPCRSDTFGLLHTSRLQTGAEMFDFSDNDMGVDAIGNVELVVNHSGPCSTATDRRFTEVLKPVPTLDSLILHFRIKPSSAAAIVDNAAAVADEPHLLYLP